MDTQLKIMIVEDDAALAREIGIFLKKWKYEAVVAEQFDDIVQEFAKIRPQLVLMDVNLPCHDGFYWCSRLRQISKVPIIYISSRSDDKDKIIAVAQGGDDYVEKPFNMELVKAKIEAILRRTYEYKVRERIFLDLKNGEKLCFDCVAQSLFMADTEIELTKSERRLLARLIDDRPDVVTRDELMMELWNTDEYVTDAALTTIISRLRSKLKSVCREDVICTRKGQGYFVK